MAEQVRKEIDALCVKYASLTKIGDVAGLGDMYTDDATLMPPNGELVVGRKDIAKSVTEAHKINKLVFEKIFYFELMNEDTAYSNGFYELRDPQGKLVEQHHDSVLWKKLCGKWYISRDIFNASSRPVEHRPQDLERPRVEARAKELYDAFNNEDIDRALNVYAVDATMIASGIFTGREAMRPVFQKIVPMMKTMIIEGMYYFELVNETTAYTNSNVKSVNKTGQIKSVFRDCLVWTKIDGEWYIRRDMFNDRPLPKE